MVKLMLSLVGLLRVQYEFQSMACGYKGSTNQVVAFATRVIPVTERVDMHPVRVAAYSCHAFAYSWSRKCVTRTVFSTTCMVTGCTRVAKLTS
jgi:hypothetical protein